MKYNSIVHGQGETKLTGTSVEEVQRRVLLWPISKLGAIRYGDRSGALTTGRERSPDDNRAIPLDSDRLMDNQKDATQAAWIELEFTSLKGMFAQTAFSSPRNWRVQNGIVKLC